MGHPMYEGLLALGYTRLGRDHPQAYRDSQGQGHLTYQRGPVRLAISVQHSLCAMGNGAVLFCSAESEDCWLKALLVDPDAQRQGHGTCAMRELETLADAHGLTVYVEPVALGALTHVHLIGLYSRFGFKPQDQLWRVMVRQPCSHLENVHEELAS